MLVAMATLLPMMAADSLDDRDTTRPSLEAKPRAIPTHGDVGQLVRGAMRVDTVQVRPVTVHPTEDQRRADVALIP